jgi:hypothetical protein
VDGEDCDEPENADLPCLAIESNAETVRGGIALFTVENPDGSGYIMVFGRTQAGEWQRWLDTQNSFLLLFLPGDVRICAEGDGLNIRERPGVGGAVVTTLADDTVARVDQFILEVPLSEDGTRGTGWYHLTAPVEGWAHSEFLSAAAFGDCVLRDAQVAAATPTAPQSVLTPTPIGGLSTQTPTG